jgi:hypothetical protein
MQRATAFFPIVTVVFKGGTICIDVLTKISVTVAIQLYHQCA